MNEYVKQPIPEPLRQLVFERDGYTCRYCGNMDGGFHADHVYPESKGGETSEKNLVTSCATCNHQKWAHVGIWPLPIGFFSEPPKPMSMLDALDKSHYDLLDRIERKFLSDNFSFAGDYAQELIKIEEDYLIRREKYFPLESLNGNKSTKNFIERFLSNG